MKIKNLFAAVAAATMLVVPAAANAGTVAGASLQGVKPVMNKEFRASRSVKKEQGLTASGYLIGALAAGLAIFAVVKVAEGDSASNG